MLLKDYLLKQNIKAKDFANQIGCSYGGVMKWLSGDRFPRPLHIHHIERETNGAVTANDFQKQISSDKNSR
jgi:DNA-binding transcriptional regulator YdaS (Cro superfamily)